MQDKLQIEILKEGFQNLKDQLLEELERKSKFVSEKMNGKLDDSIFKRVKAEETHIRNCMAFFEATKNLIDGYEAELQKTRERCDVEKRKVEFLVNDSMDYMNKYYELISINEQRRQHTEKP
jgi:hypothetical protein